MSFQHKRDRYGTYAGLAINPKNLKEADIIIQGVRFECATSGKKGTSFAIDSLRQICGDIPLILEEVFP